MKAWEWHLRIWETNTRWWLWELWTQQGRLFITPNAGYVSEQAARRAARRVMKRLGLVEAEK